jgi:hypothetical protein
MHHSLPPTPAHRRTVDLEDTSVSPSSQKSLAGRRGKWDIRTTSFNYLELPSLACCAWTGSSIEQESRLHRRPGWQVVGRMTIAKLNRDQFARMIWHAQIGITMESASGHRIVIISLSAS